MAVSPQLYRELYPEGEEPDSYEKLVAHEMSHRLHIRIIHGDEEAMGPIWFYEGFAIYAASQFSCRLPDLTPREMLEIVKNPDRGSYINYGAVFQRLASSAPLQFLVDNAAKPDFMSWVQKTIMAGD